MGALPAYQQNWENYLENSCNPCEQPLAFCSKRLRNLLQKRDLQGRRSPRRECGFNSERLVRDAMELNENPLGANQLYLRRAGCCGDTLTNAAQVTIVQRSSCTWVVRPWNGNCRRCRGGDAGCERVCHGMHQQVHRKQREQQSTELHGFPQVARIMAADVWRCKGRPIADRLLVTQPTEDQSWWKMTST